jgi:DNA repair protein RadD
LFDDLVYDWTTLDRFQQLVDEGYLARLTTKRTALEMDTTGITLKAGDFNEKQLAKRFDRDGVTEEAIKEIIAAGRNRKKWLIFAIDISHAEHIAEVLIRAGVRTAPVHSTMDESGFDRDRVIEGFRNGYYQAVVNVNILTTGFDEPGIDLIAMLRPTKSPVLHVQSLGRGSRVSPDKDNCLILDFAGNTARLGPINNVYVAIKGKSAGGGDAVTKTCPSCNSILPPAIRVCPDCDHKFLIEHRLQGHADLVEVIDAGKPIWLKVLGVEYKKHSNYGSPSTVKVTYNAEGHSVNEFICIEHKGYAKHKAQHWIQYRGGVPCSTADELIANSATLRVPNKIRVQRDKKYLVIKDFSF